jgi:hypothetical protein
LRDSKDIVNKLNSDRRLRARTTARYPTDNSANLIAVSDQ